MSTFRSARIALGVVLATLAAAAALAMSTAGASGQANIYSVHNLVSDGPAVAASATDSSLVNSWGLSRLS